MNRGLARILHGMRGNRFAEPHFAGLELHLLALATGECARERSSLERAGDANRKLHAVAFRTRLHSDFNDADLVVHQDVRERYLGRLGGLRFNSFLALFHFYVLVFRLRRERFKSLAVRLTPGLADRHVEDGKALHWSSTSAPCFSASALCLRGNARSSSAMLGSI